MSTLTRLPGVVLVVGLLLAACQALPTASPAPTPAMPTRAPVVSPSLTMPIACDPAALIQAIEAANRASGLTVLSLAANCVYSLADTYQTNPPWRIGLPPITRAVQIDGHGAVIERSLMAPNFRLFYIAPPGSLTLNDLTLRNGKAVAGPGFDGAGGAIYTEGALWMQRVTLAHNLSEGGAGAVDGPVSSLPGHPALGAAIFVAGGSVNILNSALSGNLASGGSGAADVCSAHIPGDCRVSSIDQGAENLELTQLGNFGVGGRGGESLNDTPVPGATGGYGGGAGGAGTLSEYSNIGGSPHLIGGPGGGGGGGGFGGGLFIDGGSVTITDSLFTENTATGGLGGLGVGSGCCHSPAGEPGQGLGADIFWRHGQLNLAGTQARTEQSP